MGLKASMVGEWAWRTVEEVSPSTYWGRVGRLGGVGCGCPLWLLGASSREAGVEVQADDDSTGPSTCLGRVGLGSFAWA